MLHQPVESRLAVRIEVHPRLGGQAEHIGRPDVRQLPDSLGEVANQRQGLGIEDAAGGVPDHCDGNRLGKAKKGIHALFGCQRRVPGRYERIGTGVARELEGAAANGQRQHRAENQHGNRMMGDEAEVAPQPAFRRRRFAIDTRIDGSSL